MCLRSSQADRTLTTTARFMATVVILVVFYRVAHAINSNRGREFIIGILENRVLVQAPIIRIFVTSSSQVNVDVNISTPLYRSLSPAHLTLEPNEMVVKEYPYELHMNGNEFSSKAIHIEASGDVTVQGASINDLSSDAYLALPTHVLGVDYFIMAYIFKPVSQHMQGPTQLGLVGVYDNTRVVLTLPRDDISIMSFTNKHKKDRRYLIYLDRFSTVQLQSFNDLTGTRIQSDKPVSVFSGAVWTSVSMEFMGDHMVEHLPPTSSWGSQFFTVPVANRTAGDMFRVLAREDETHLRIFDPDESPQNMVIGHINTGDYFDFEAPSNQSLHLITSKAVLLAQFSKSYEVDHVRRNDPFMTIVPPVEQFTNHYTFSTPTTLLLHVNDDFDHYLNVIILTELLDGLMLDGRPLDDSDMFTNWTYLVHSNYSYATLTLSTGVHNIWHDAKDASFSATLYGVKFQESYAHPLGQNVEIIDKACTKTFNIGDDKFDNDCDSLFDEELMNGIDDDGDGLIDEDIASSVDASKDAKMVMENGSDWADWKNVKQKSVLAVTIDQYSNTDKYETTDTTTPHPTKLTTNACGVSGTNENCVKDSTPDPDPDYPHVMRLLVNGTWVNATITGDGTGVIFQNGQWVKVNTSDLLNTTINNNNYNQHIGSSSSNKSADVVQKENDGGFWLNGTWVPLFRNTSDGTFWWNGQKIQLNSSNDEIGFWWNGKWVKIHSKSSHPTTATPTTTTTAAVTGGLIQGFWLNGVWIPITISNNSREFVWNGKVISLDTLTNNTGFWWDGQWIPIASHTKDNSDMDDTDTDSVHEIHTFGFWLNNTWVQVNVSSSTNQSGFWLHGKWISVNPSTNPEKGGFWWNGQWIAFEKQNSQATNDSDSDGGDKSDETQSRGFWWNNVWIPFNASSTGGRNSTGFWWNNNWIKFNSTEYRSTDKFPQPTHDTPISDVQGFWWNGAWVTVDKTKNGFWFDGTWVQLNNTEVNDNGFWWNGEWVTISGKSTNQFNATEESDIRRIWWNGTWVIINETDKGFWWNGKWIPINTTDGNNNTEMHFSWNGYVKTTPSVLTGVDSGGVQGMTPEYKWLKSFGFWLNGTWIPLNISSLSDDGRRFWWNGQWLTINSSSDSTGFWLNGRWIDITNSSIKRETEIPKTDYRRTNNTAVSTGFWFDGKWTSLNLTSSNNSSQIGFWWRGQWIQLNQSGNSSQTGFWWQGKWVDISSVADKKDNNNTMNTKDNSSEIASNSIGFWWNGAWINVNITSGIGKNGTGFFWNGKWIVVNSSNDSTNTGFWVDGKWVDLHTDGRDEDTHIKSASKKENDKASVIIDEVWFWLNGSWISANITFNRHTNSTGFYWNGQWVEVNLATGTQDSDYAGFFINGKWINATSNEQNAPRKNTKGTNITEFNTTTTRIWWNGTWIIVNVSNINGNNKTKIWWNGKWITSNTSDHNEGVDGFWFNGQWIQSQSPQDKDTTSTNISVNANLDKVGFWWRGEWIQLNSTANGFMWNGTWIQLNVTSENHKKDGGFWWNGVWIKTASKPTAPSNVSVGKGDSMGFWWKGSWIPINTTSSDKNGTVSFWWNGVWVNVNSSSSDLGGWWQGEKTSTTQSSISSKSEDPRHFDNSKVAHDDDGDHETTTAVLNDKGTHIWWNGQWVALNVTAGNDKNVTFWWNGKWVTVEKSDFPNTNAVTDKTKEKESQPTDKKPQDDTNNNGFWWQGKWIAMKDTTDSKSNATGIWWEGQWVKWGEKIGNKVTTENILSPVNTTIGNGAAFWWNGKLVTVSENAITGRNESGFLWNGQWIDTSHLVYNRSPGHVELSISGSFTTPMHDATTGTFNATEEITHNVSGVAAKTPRSNKSKAVTFNILMIIIPLSVVAGVTSVCIIYCCCTGCLYKKKKNRKKVAPQKYAVQIGSQQCLLTSSSASQSPSPPPRPPMDFLSIDCASIASDLYGGFDPVVLSPLSTRRVTWRSPNNEYPVKSGHWKRSEEGRKSAPVSGRRSPKRTRSTRIVLLENELRSIRLE